MLRTGEAENTASAAARLNSLLDAAFHNEASYGDLTEEEANKSAKEKKENIYGSIAGMSSSVLGEVPVVGLALSGAFDYVADRSEERRVGKESGGAWSREQGEREGKHGGV